MPYDDYTKLRKLGQGSFGCIFLVQDKSNRKAYVMKEVDLSSMNEQGRQEALKEVKFLSQLNHPNIISYKEFFERDTPSGRGKRKRILYIIMEYADGGDLSARIKKHRGFFQEAQLVDWLTQICLCLKHMHDRKILHRDIKSENVFLTRDNLVKLGDFGISKSLAHTFAQAQTRIGTPYYLSPEICLNQPYDSKNDMWALGVVMYEVMTLKHPFDADSMEKLLDKIVRGRPAPLPRNFSPQLRNVVEWLLKKDPRKRPTVHELLKLPFIKEQVHKFLSDNEFKDEFSHTVLHSYKYQADKEKAGKAKAKAEGRGGVDRGGVDSLDDELRMGKKSSAAAAQKSGQGRRSGAAHHDHRGAPRTPKKRMGSPGGRQRRPPPSPGVARAPMRDHMPAPAGGAGGDLGMSINAAPWREDRERLGSRRGGRNKQQDDRHVVAAREREEELAKIRQRYFKERKEAQERMHHKGGGTPTRAGRARAVMSPRRKSHYGDESRRERRREAGGDPSHRGGGGDPPERRREAGGDPSHRGGGGNPFPTQARPGRRRGGAADYPNDAIDEHARGGQGGYGRNEQPNPRSSPRYGRRRGRPNDGGGGGGGGRAGGYSNVGKALYRAINS